MASFILKHIIFCGLMLSAGALYAVPDNYVFRTMSPEGGFYYDGVKSIMQDDNGFIWVLMDNDLYRFDGYEYKRYNTVFRDMDNSAKWIFNNLSEDKEGRIIVSTNQGIFRYHKISDSFELLSDSPGNYIHFDPRSNMWIRREGHSLSVVYSGSGRNHTPLFDGRSLSYVGNIAFSHGDDFYVFSTYGILFRYDYDTEEFKYCMNMPDEDGRIEGVEIVNGNIWVTVNKYGLYQIDLAGFTVTDHFVPDPEIITGTNKDMAVDRYGNVWIGTTDGTYVVDLSTQEYKVFRNVADDPYSLPHNSVWCLTSDHLGNIWIGTYAGGMCYVNVDERQPFVSFRPQRRGLNYAPVSCFADDGKHIWIGTEGGGINRMNKDEGTFSYLTSGRTGLSFNNIKSLSIDNSGIIWIATYQGGLNRYDPEKGEFRVLRQQAGSDNGLSVNSLRKVVASTDGRGLWIAYQEQKLILTFLSFADESLEHIRFDPESDQYIFDITTDTEGNLWIVTMEALYRLDQRTREVTRLTVDPDRYLYAQTLIADGSGNIWIGTGGSGLYRYDTVTGNAERLFAGTELESVSIYSLCTDHEGDLWLGTDGGLVRYDPEKKVFARFDARDGAQGDVYYPLASYRSPDGRLYFGGTNGFTVVEPDKVSFNSYKPNVSIAGIFIDNNPVSFESVMKKGRRSSGDNMEIVLCHRESNFGFSFASDNYLIPEKNRFRYRLRGYDNRWTTADASSRWVSYTKVPAGVYYFEVVTANNDGIWNEIPVVVKIVRRHAPWNSPWAYALYTLLFLLAARFIIYHYSEKKKLKLELYLDKVEKDKQEEIHQTQLRFFTNISHDFRTPLSLIAGAVDRLKESGLSDYYYRILDNNTRRLNGLITELMDFRKVANGMQEVNIHSFSLKDMIGNIGEDFSEHANQRGISFRVSYDPEMPDKVWGDSNIIEKIVMNLMQNAMRYTRNGGEVWLEVLASSEKLTPRFETSYTVSGDPSPHRTFIIAVRDTGVGITKESIASVFDRFYKVNTVNDDLHLGTGIGLALVRSLVFLHRGTCSIFSERDEGTDMIVGFSSDPRFYTELGMLDAAEILEESEELEEKDRETPDKKTEEQTEEAQRTILVAEDNEDLRKMIADYFSEDYTVLQASNGIAAERIVAEENVSLIISDIMMPLKDGITFCREIKNNLETSHIPFVMLTAKTTLESKIEGVDSGADLYFEKPVDFGLLRISVRNIFMQQQNLREHYYRNYFSDSSELTQNQHDSEFLSRFIAILDTNIENADINGIAQEMCMSRSTFYNKLKSLTGRSPVEFIQNYRMKKAAKLLVEGKMTIREIMESIGIESQAYFSNSFKKEFGLTPTAFAAKNNKSQ